MVQHTSHDHTDLDGLRGPIVTSLDNTHSSTLDAPSYNCHGSSRIQYKHGYLSACRPRWMMHFHHYLLGAPGLFIPLAGLAIGSAKAERCLGTIYSDLAIL